MKGMRVQSIIRELRGEKIDIIEFSDDPVNFATHALSPAKISRVSIADAAEKHMEVIVDDSQLSLAIGKKGQNVRLAAKLLGWKIDIKSEEEKRQEVETQMAALTVPGAPVSVLIDYGLGDKVAEKLVEAGISTVEKLGSMTPEQLEEIPGIGAELVGAIQLAVNNYYGQFETGESGAGQPSAPAAIADQGELAAEVTPGETIVAEPPQETAQAPLEEAKTEPGAEPVASESDTIKESPPEAHGEEPEEQSEGNKEG
jgi:N utilization substance protein A